MSDVSAWLDANAFFCEHFGGRLAPAHCIARQLADCEDRSQNCYCASRTCPQGSKVAENIVEVSKARAEGSPHNITDEDRFAVARYLNRLGRSRAELASILGVPYTTLSNWMTCRQRIPASYYRVLREVLRTKPGTEGASRESR